MEELLRKLLVVDPRKRMNYGEFLTFVHQLTGTSVTVLPLQSTVRYYSYKFFMNESQATSTGMCMVFKIRFQQNDRRTAT